MIHLKKLGKKIYTSRMLWPLRLLVLGVFLFLLVNLFLQTSHDPNYVKWSDHSFLGTLRFHLFYAEELLMFVVTVFIPSFYYGVLRSIRFFENGIIINRGLPFFNREIFYSQIKSYKIIHPKYLISIIRSDMEDEILLSVSNMQRAIAILDNHNIPGDLGNKEFQESLSVNKKFVFIVIGFAIIVFFFQYFGLARYILRVV